jgi:hypothetical protein
MPHNIGAFVAANTRILVTLPNPGKRVHKQNLQMDQRHGVADYTDNTPLALASKMRLNDDSELQPYGYLCPLNTETLPRSDPKPCPVLCCSATVTNTQRNW